MAYKFCPYCGASKGRLSNTTTCKDGSHRNYYKCEGCQGKWTTAERMITRVKNQCKPTPRSLQTSDESQEGGAQKILRKPVESHDIASDVAIVKRSTVALQAWLMTPRKD